MQQLNTRSKYSIPKVCENNLHTVEQALISQIAIFFGDRNVLILSNLVTLSGKLNRMYGVQWSCEEVLRPRQQITINIVNILLNNITSLISLLQFGYSKDI